VSTLLEQCVAKIKTVWDTGLPAGVPTLERDRRWDLTSGQLPSALLGIVYDEPSTPEKRDDSSDTEDPGGLSFRTTHVGIELRAGSSSEADPLLARVGQLEGWVNADSPFFHLAHRLKVGRMTHAIAFSSAKQPYLYWAVEILIFRQQAVGDPTKWA
jgi:hypothetical protein